MTTQAILALLITFVMMVLYTWQPIPMSMAGLICSVAMFLIGGIKASNMLNNFGNASGVLIICFFIVGAGFRKTQLVKHISNLLYKAGGGSFQRVMIIYCLITYLLCQCVSNTSIALSIVFPMLMGMCEEMHVDPARAIYPVGFIGITCMKSLPIGNTLTRAAQFNGYLEKYAYTTFHAEVLDTPIQRFPLSLVCLALAIFLIPKLLPEKGANEIVRSKLKDVGGSKKLSPVQEFLGYACFFGTSLCLIFQKSLSFMPTWMFAFIAVIILVCTGVLSKKEAQAAMPMQLWLIYVSSLNIGQGLVNTGAGDAVGGIIRSIIGANPNNYVLGLIFFLVPFIMTQFMMNASVPGIVHPIAILTCKALGANPIGIMLLVQSAATTAFLLPPATVGVPMMMDYGGYNTKQLLKIGWLPAIILTIVSVAYTMTIYPAL